MINKTFFSKILIAAGAFLVAFFVAEFALRIMGYHPIFMQMDIFVEKDNELLPYTLKPNYTGYQVGKNVVIDSEGYRVV